MFDIGFWELVLISVIGLVVLGPERLPVAIRTVRGWISNVRGFSNNIKTELTEELRIHELHSNLKKAEQQNMQNLTAEMSDSVKSLQEAAAMVTRPYEKEKVSKDDKTSAQISSTPSTTQKDEKQTE
jgi:sec-independent protein translocase protein TatB